MDDRRFDLLTRRLMLTGVGGGSFGALLGLAEAASKKKPSKRKRCRKKNRTYCAGRCCPKGRRCEKRACVQSCENPFVCPDQGGGSGCGNNGDTLCFCSTTISGTSACVISEPAPCNNFAPCGIADPCPAGQICAICGCLGATGATSDFRCKRPCPPG